MSPRILLAAIAALAVLTTVSGTALAHEHTDVADGKYALTIGWRTEPAFAGAPNGLDLRIEKYNEPAPEGEHHAATNVGCGPATPAHAASGPARTKAPVTSGIVGNLTVTYEIAGKTFPATNDDRTNFNFRARFGSPGSYTGEITPTREGEYKVRIQGTIEGTPIDVTMCPEVIKTNRATMFPAPDLTPEESSAKIAALEKQLADLKAEVQAMKVGTNGEPVTPTEKNATPGVGALLGALAVVGAAFVLGRRRS